MRGCARFAREGFPATLFGLAIFAFLAVTARAQPPVVAPESVDPPADGVAVGARQFEIIGRSGLAPQITAFEQNGESVAVFTGGFNILIHGVQAPQLADLGLETNLGTVDIETDRAVIWSQGINFSGATLQPRDAPLEIYMEGHIIFRQGDHIVFAERMYYDVRQNVGVILDAELITPVPAFDGKSYESLVRLKAASLRRLNESQYLARDALVTTSRLDAPSYHLAAGTLLFEDVQQPAIEPVTGLPLIDPATGAPQIDHRQLVTAQSNRLYVEGVPVFYWPRIATDLQRPTYFVNNVRVRNDSIFGTQLLVDVDAYQVLGWQPIDGTDWEFSSDYLSERGPAGGTRFTHQNISVPLLAGTGTGQIDVWGIDDGGLDYLGRGRQGIVPEATLRYQVNAWHRHWFDNGWQLTGQVGAYSDRTFREQYYEQQYEEGLDRYTRLDLERTAGLQALSISANVRVNNFETQTERLPEFHHYWLGQPLLANHLTWFEHTSLGYLNMKVASTPTNPTLLSFFKILPWEADVAGERVISRQEVDLPLEVGAFRVVPFALGEMGHWGEDLGGEDRQRAYFQSGVRASVPMWAVFPNVFDPLFNLNGLAHKVVFDAEASYADANRNVDQFPLYDPLDYDAIEDYRRMLFFTTFGGTLPGSVPPPFDARSYAIRSGTQGWVTASAPEVVEDLQAVRIGMRHRLQTKRGRPGAQHIIDWLTFDANAVWFPDANRDNFGEDIGLVNYGLRWHLGDRFTVLSDGQADFFAEGLQTVSAGVLLNRPLVGNAYLGLRSLNGPIEANVLTASYAYRMTPKWVSYASSSVDLGNTGNIGQTFAITRVGESLLVTAGFTFDASKNNVGVRLLVEPRFLTARVTRQTGLEIPPAGAVGIE